ncbi:MAG: hypothetical protein HY791_32820 [Deltaproteobacteria bacterium]|nr:hypothetical protein [Deltaproteobacteria bacterium]
MRSIGFELVFLGLFAATVSACSSGSSEDAGADDRGSVPDGGSDGGPKDVEGVEAGQGDAESLDGSQRPDVRVDAGRDVDSGGVNLDSGVDGGILLDAATADATADAGPLSAERYFPPSAWMYQDISSAALSTDSDVVTQWLSDNGGFGLGRIQIDFSIEVLTADGSPRQTFEPTGDFYDPDCDRVLMPLPAGGALEGESGYECTSDGDCHLIVVDRAAGRLYEMWRANVTGGTFYGGCAVLWDLTRTYPAEGRGEQCTSADAAGFPIAPLLFSADEVAAGHIDHAIRFILPNARMRRGYYVRPASHAGGPSGPGQAPVYGTRWRLRADYPLETLPNDAARVVARALQQYGMALADGGNVALTAQSDRFTTHSWAEVGLEPRDLAAIQPTDFEVIDTGAPIELTFDCMRTPISEF